MVGKLPVKSREWVRHISAFPGDGYGASASEGNIALFGGVVQSALIHELGHVLDENVVGTVIGGNKVAYSLQSEWKWIVSRGACVATQYAKDEILLKDNWAEVRPYLLTHKPIC